MTTMRGGVDELVDATPCEGESLIDVGAVAELPEGEMMAVAVQGRGYVVVNVDGDFFALADRCPHQGAKLSCGLISGAMLPGAPGDDLQFALDGEVIVCPWHRWKFSVRSGDALFGVDRRRVPTVPVRVEAGRILLEIATPRVAAAQPAGT